jgi:uncharacterized membrane protein YdbT with pleckstrin-like domain
VATGPGDLILEPNENVLLATRPLFLWEPLVLLDILLIVGSLYFAAPNTGMANTALSAGLLITAVVLMLWLLIKWIPWSRRWYVLTDRRVISKWGVFNRHQAALLLDRVQDASLSRPFPLSLVRDYGVIHLETAGEQSQERISGGLQNLSMTQSTTFYRTLTDVQTREHEYLSRDPEATIRQR